MALVALLCLVQWLALSKNQRADTSVVAGRDFIYSTPHLYSKLLYLPFSFSLSQLLLKSNYVLETHEMKKGPDNLSVSGSFVKSKLN